MKKVKLIYIYAILTLFTTMGCSDVLDTEASNAFGEDLIYSDPAQVERLVFNVYNSTESWSVNRNEWWGLRFNIENASFESKFNFQNLDLFKDQAGWTSSDVGMLGNKWTNYFYYIRLSNEFLDRIDKSKAMQVNPAKVNVLKAEMRFLRANLYSKLIKFFGGVPIMEHALGLNDDFNIKRNSYEECVNFIVKELDEVATVLPPTRPDSEFGRATKLAALAVKSRTLLYAASKLHDPAFAPKNDPLYVYTKATKWQDAADAAKAVVDLVGARNLIATANATEYQKLFLAPNADIIFARPYGSQYYEYGTDANSLPDLTQSPNGYGGWALSSPTHNFSLEFNMNDGSTTAGASFNPAAPNANREMRYYANLLFNGAQFRGREVQYFLSEEVNGVPVFPHGLDSPKGLGNVQHSSKTGYNIRKFQDETVAVAGGISPKRPYVLYRLAEIYLNYAEALYHLNDETTARTFLNKVASRALQPTITATGPALLEAIKRERRVELCFEGHSFFDERRWMNEAHLGFPIKGLTWKKSAAGIVSNTEYTVITRPWDVKQYYLPIPRTEREKAPALAQNFGY
ncbi:RagB/SusD family nutrient uptake outer membrane protein [Flavobacterium sp. NG2]|uniref:RagB/SusD family nutrient uptake outer membrane protein n=1 Tax=Flavobacterium sp. NG2 TaxID=3097547 RepID=UPI002A7F53FE|nr:RagB/SusD family nutrient uptake outer membrane protein [Flavobacterium sp. NG2]WPR71386.1 RagB/SusD family nutrient uptake outer membrane protein [Flavobacterium sp. NG2]